VTKKTPQSAGDVISALVGGSREKTLLEAMQAPTTDFDRQAMARAAAYSAKQVRHVGRADEAPSNGTAHEREVLSPRASGEHAEALPVYGVEELTEETLNAQGFAPD